MVTGEELGVVVDLQTHGTRQAFHLSGIGVRLHCHALQVSVLGSDTQGTQVNLGIFVYARVRASARACVSLTLRTC